MTTTVKVLLESKLAETAETIQYQSPAGTKTAIDKLTAVNVSSGMATITVHLVGPLGTAGSANSFVKTLQPNAIWTAPEVAGHYMEAGGFVSTIASVANAISIRLSGRQIT